jgi:DNA-binding transcriptional regulator YhcF (GntR family)
LYEVVATLRRANGRRLALTMHLVVDTAAATPPYEQIRAQIQAMVAAGTLPVGTRLPPIRQLAGDLGLATNTVGRAYRELEAAGVAEARGRHGTVITGATVMDAPQRRRVVDDAADAYARSALHHGAGLDEALAAVRDAFDRLRDRGAPMLPGEGTP